MQLFDLLLSHLRSDASFSRSLGIVLTASLLSHGCSSESSSVSVSGGAAESEPRWKTRLYEGTVTLDNYDSLDSIVKRSKSEIASALMQDIAGLQSPDFSGQLVSGEQVAAITLFLVTGGHLGWAHDVADLTGDIRQTGPVFEGIGFDTHQRIQIYYSDSVVEWLRTDRLGEIPDGAMIVKQMYSSDPADTKYGAAKTTGWAVMIRNGAASKDGWIWYLFFFPGAPPYGAPLPVFYSQAGDSFCLSCHAAADNEYVTFSALQNLQGASQEYSWIENVVPGLFAQSSDPNQAGAGGGGASDENGSADQPTISMPSLATLLASGTTQFQKLGHAANSDLESLRPNIADGRHALDWLRDEASRVSRLGRKAKGSLLEDLVQRVERGADSSLEQVIERLESSGPVLLLEEFIADLEHALSDDELGEFLNETMELYFRAVLQGATVEPLAEPDPDIIAAYGKRSEVQLPESQVDINWFALDYIFSHTPALPADMPLDVCETYNKQRSKESSDVRSTFITSDNCNGCHWNYVLQGQAQPAMLRQDNTSPLSSPSESVFWDISPFAEWSASPMGLAGRDPIFQAQLAWEEANAPDLKNKISNLCTRCHQPGAQRQFHLDQGDTEDPAGISPPGVVDPFPLFSSEVFDHPPSSKVDDSAKYGALARDGITCSVCHQIEAKDLGEQSTFTGQFHFPEKPGPIWGPYPDDEILPYMMEQAIGMTPKHGAHINEAALCGSCHTVITPILSDHLEHTKKQSKKHGKKYRSTYEQTTYVEWLNSSFADSEEGQTCQECHMPSRAPSASPTDDEPLTSVLANVETAYLPAVANRAADAKITNQAKSHYRRHTLVGMNQFLNQMFQQLPYLLGNSYKNAGGAQNVQAPLVLAQHEMEAMAAHRTADISILRATSRETEDKLAFEVRVTNKAGHKFPSGVGFRRAFIEFEVLNESGEVLWASGRTNSVGLLVDDLGNVLQNEWTKDPLKIESGDPVISSQDHAYIFEERTATWTTPPGPEEPNLSEMELTTSFLELATEVKDTRLLPQGWTADGPYASVTRLHLLDKEAGKTVDYYPEVPGERTILYLIPKSTKGAVKARAKIRYQSIPPYYIADRLTYDTTETRRLYYLISHLRTQGTPIEGWSIEIVRDELGL